MGNKSSKSTKGKPSEEKAISGLLPTVGLELQHYDIENLAFAHCGAAGVSYMGAMRVLETLGLLQKIKRFSGVGTGAIVAAFLAIGLQSKELQTAFNEYLGKVQSDDEIGFENYAEKLIVDYGWNSGSKFFDWLDELLESKSFDSNLTFVQLYEKTGKELCVLVTNVDTLKIEYFHPKTTPDLSIKQALFMAISTPGSFVPTKYGPADDKYLYANGNILCNYPIHCFDGWLLSMEEKDSFLNKLESPADFYLPKVFDPQNLKTIGFFPLDKKQEITCKEFVERVHSSKESRIPSSTLGLGYMAELQNDTALTLKFSLLRKACSSLLVMAEELADTEGNISLDTFTNKMFTDNFLTKSDRLLFPEIGETQQELNDFLLTLSSTGTTFSLSSLTFNIQNKLICLLEEYSAYQKTDINSLQSYFGNIFETGFSSNTQLAESDYDRTVSILYGYIKTRDVDFEECDQNFLYRQGWNATVNYLQNYPQQIVQRQRTDTDIY